MSDERQWMRVCTLAVGGEDGDALDLSGLRIKFQTRKGDIETPNSAVIEVYNVAPETLQRVQKEFTRVVLQAGYQGNYGIIFDGAIRQTRFWRDSGVDSVMSILAADGDRAYNYAVVNTTLAAGSRPADHVAACQSAFAAQGAGAGYLPALGGQPLPRGKVMYGMARKYMRDTARNTNTTWSIQDGKVQLVPAAGYLPGEAVVLTAETGLIGAPEQTQAGITLRCLLNPRLRIGGRVKLDNESVKRAQTPLKMAATYPPRLDEDGFYRIIKAEFSGDTHGNDWYANLVCIGIDDTMHLPLDQLGA